jgi:cytochrome c peroxidase
MKLISSRIALLGIVSFAILLAVLWWFTERHAIPKSDYVLRESLQPINVDFTQPIPLKLSLDPNKVKLGRKLFHDSRLSGNDTISCASCHVLSAGGVDNRVHSIGINGAEGGINAPTVFNSAFNFVQFWDGRAATLEDQIEGPLNNPIEMGTSWPQVLPKLTKDPDYPAEFSRIYADKEISPANIKDAIADFERSLLTPNSRFDKYLRGDKTALSSNEMHGYSLFQSYGCVSCHQGINLGGNMFERMGLMSDYFGDRGHPTDADNGRYNVTKNEADRHFFRVPSLRNVGLTAPYFHDGSAATLPEAVRFMAKYQLGRKIEDDDLNDIVSFLFSLTGELNIGD